MNRQIFILGTRGIPANHGGFETFAQHLALYLKEQNYSVTVYCQDDHQNKTTEWHGIQCIHILPRLIGRNFYGSLGSIIFDLLALLHALKHNSKDAVWLTLGYNTAFLNIIPWLFKRRQIINMDGLEWKRQKWGFFSKAFLFLNYLCSALFGNILIADHPEIQKVLQKHFGSKPIAMIAYGADEIVGADQSLLNKFGIAAHQYYIVIARPEPENSILEIVEAWTDSARRYKLVILGNYNPNNAYHQTVLSIAGRDVIFTGAVYDPATVQALRFYARAYIHGHQVGGTNPSLVEALSAGNAIIAHDNPFNRWVAMEAGVYFKDREALQIIFDLLDRNQIDLESMRHQARVRHHSQFEWLPVFQAYEALFQKLK